MYAIRSYYDPDAAARYVDALARQEKLVERGLGALDLKAEARGVDQRAGRRGADLP